MNLTDGTAPPGRAPRHQAEAPRKKPRLRAISQLYHILHRDTVPRPARVSGYQRCPVGGVTTVGP